MDILEILLLSAINLGLAVFAGAYLGHTGLLDLENSKLGFRKRIIVGIIIFGSLAFIGEYSCSAVGYTFRDGGVISGGLFFGPFIGIGAALMVLAYRVTLGGITLIPCIIGTLLAGTISGTVYYRYKEKITVVTATLVALIIELIHVGMVIVFLPDGQGADIIFSEIGLLVVIMSTIFVLVFTASYFTMKVNRNSN